MGLTETLERSESQQGQTHVDVLIVGAGISGIGAAYHLQQQCPGKSFAILETQGGFGGTWRTHKYPGIRSDSDLYTFGYRFKPWIGAPIATSDEIMAYLNEVIDENDIERHVHFHHQITNAAWSSADKCWTVTATNTSSGETQQFTTNFLWMCQGYYSHTDPYTPDWPGMADFKGQIIHPQLWPDDADMKGKRAIVIGSGATAATVVPAIADDVEHVTMLQRSPTYFLPSSNSNELADRLRQIGVEEETVHHCVRQQINFDMDQLIKRCSTEPDVVTAELKEAAMAFLPEGYDFDAHFKPSYRPWQQRMAFVPEGDLFQAVAKGKASVVTDHIERFTPKGILLKSGQELEADVIITATGFKLSVLGEIAFAVDGKPVDLADTVTWRGMMFTGMPNLLWVFGYFRASWTLRVDLLGDFVCKLLNHMEKLGVQSVVPQMSGEEQKAERRPWMEKENFNPGYLDRSMHLMPKRLEGEIWTHRQEYWAEKDELPKIRLEDEALVFG